MEFRIVRYALRNPEAVYGRLVLLCRGGVGVGGSGETGGVGVGGMGVVPSNLAVSMVAGISMSAPRGSRRLEETRDSPIYQPLNVPLGVATAVILFSQ